MASTMIQEKGRKRGFRTRDLRGLGADEPTGESVAWKCELTGNPERREVWREATRFELLEDVLDEQGKRIPSAFSPQGHPLPGRYERKRVYISDLADKNLPDPKTIDGFVEFDLRNDGVYIVREFIVIDQLNGNTSKLYTFRPDPKQAEREAERDARDKALARIGSLPADKLDALFEALTGSEE